jgi:proteasome assembly chaperone 2
MPLPAVRPLQVLVLGSLEAGFRRDAQLVGPQLRRWAPDGQTSGALLERCAAAAPGGVPTLEPAFLEDRPAEQRLLQPWPLLLALKAEDVPCAALLSFSSEGDNLADAFLMAEAAAAAVGIQAGREHGSGSAERQPQPKWVPPRSWQTVYGTNTPVY